MCLLGLEESWWLSWAHNAWTWAPAPSLLLYPSPVPFLKLCPSLSFCIHLGLYSQLHLFLISVGCYYLIFQPSDFSFLIFWVHLSLIISLWLYYETWTCRKPIYIISFCITQPRSKCRQMTKKSLMIVLLCRAASYINSTSHIPSFMIFHLSLPASSLPGLPTLFFITLTLALFHAWFQT